MYIDKKYIYVTLIHIYSEIKCATDMKKKRDMNTGAIEE